MPQYMCVCMWVQRLLPLLYVHHHPIPWQTVPKLHSDMKHQHQLYRFKAWRWVLQRKDLALNSQFAIAILQNFFLLVNNSYAMKGLDRLEAGIEEEGEAYSYLDTLEGIITGANYTLGIFQCFSCVIVFTIVAFLNFPTRQVMRRQRDGTEMVTRW